MMARMIPSDAQRDDEVLDLLEGALGQIVPRRERHPQFKRCPANLLKHDVGTFSTKAIHLIDGANEAPAHGLLVVGRHAVSPSIPCKGQPGPAVRTTEQ